MLAADPTWPAVSGRGMALLSLGRFTEGWADYEFRVGSTHSDTLSFAAVVGRLAARRGTLLIHCEQGLGDTLQFIRYGKVAAEYAVRTSSLPRHRH